VPRYHVLLRYLSIPMMTVHFRKLAKCLPAALTLFGAAAQASTFVLPPPGEHLIGRGQTIEARYEDTLLDIARRYNLGYLDIHNANPGVDTWIPGDGTEIRLPTIYLLPDAPREGIVINIAEMRLYYYPAQGMNGSNVVTTHPVSIGREDWATPLGLTKVVKKDRDPAWHPPESIRAEHAKEGDYLPKVVPAGPDNPLGKYALRLALAGYLIHGTDKPFGIGMQVTHGCMRLYPEDIETMFGQVAVGTPVRLVFQPYKAGWHNGMLYIEAHPPLEGENRLDQTALVETVVNATRDHPDYRVDWDTVRHLAEVAEGIPVEVPPLGPGEAYQPPLRTPGASEPRGYEDPGPSPMDWF
jgi:L,D-transpeptidase ErfK/SrfK